ncbi:FitA-like ribbon-helix-helix domain-containing protein [Xanthomonas arboricola]|uniref:FitA-like ribbon-helix-helix domain-containing protein n=1 Tax=Xanthomonas arboricola TaxID=56448 RepID=UPI0017B1AF00|nr:plasmid stability protein [Xanthomonas arboricola]
MPSFTVRNIPDDVHRAIRARAALHGRSTEANEPKLPSARSSITRRLQTSAPLVFAQLGT